MYMLTAEVRGSDSLSETELADNLFALLCIECLPEVDVYAWSPWRKHPNNLISTLSILVLLTSSQYVPVQRLHRRSTASRRHHR